jgi:4-amino-4-deoxy-L-arabinose transferase-like glycosyltransferase
MGRGDPRAIDRDRLAVLTLFGAALALRLLHLQQIHAYDPYFHHPSIDEESYHVWARAIAGGDWFGQTQDVLYLGPLYPYLLAPFYAVFGSNLLIPKLLHCVLGAGTCALVYLLGRELFDRRVGAIAGALTAGYAMLVFYGGHLLLENALVPLIVAVVLYTVRSLHDPTLRRWLATGALTGLATLGRENLLLYFAGVLIWMPIALRDRLDVRARLLRAGAFALAFAAFVAPVSARNSWLDGSFVLTNHTGGIVLYTAWHPDATGTYSVPRFMPAEKTGTPEEQRMVYARVAERELGVAYGTMRPSQVSSYWARRALEEIARDPPRTLRLLARKLDLLANRGEVWDIRPLELARDFSWVLRLPLLSFGLIAPLGLAGIALTLSRWRELVPAYGLLAVVVVTCLAFTVLERYRVLAVPLLSMFAAAALVQAYDAWRERRFRALALASLVYLASTGVGHRTIREDDYSMGHFNLANKYVELERWSLAVEQFERAAALRPSKLSFQNNLALSYERAGRPDDARTAWTRVRDLAAAQARPDYVERATRHLRELAGRGGSN